MADTTTVASERGTREHMYEGMFLLESGRYSSDPDGATNELLGLLQKFGATVDLHRPWQEGKLAYEIEGHRRGVHYLVLFRMPARNVTDLNRACRLNDLVIRQLLIAHEQRIYDASLHALSPEAAGEQEAAEEPAPAERRRSREESEDEE